MSDTDVYPFGPQKPPRLTPTKGVMVRGSRELSETKPQSQSQWKPIEVVPRVDNVSGSDLGSELPKYKVILEWNAVTGKYRVRPLTDLVDLYDVCGDD